VAKGNPGVPKPCAPRNQARLQSVYMAICQYPGKQPVEIAEFLGLTKSQVLNALVSMDNGGFFLSETCNRLYSFRAVEASYAMELQRQIWT